MRYVHMSKTVEINLANNNAKIVTLDNPMLQIGNPDDFVTARYGSLNKFQGFIYNINLAMGQHNLLYSNFACSGWGCEETNQYELWNCDGN